MSVLVYAESSEGKFKKIAFETVSYGKKVAELLETSLSVVTINANNVSSLSDYGAQKIITVNNDKLNTFNAKAYADVLKQVAEKESANIVIIDSSNNGLYLAPLLAVNLEAGYASNVVEAPSSISPFTVKRKAFSNKAFNTTEIKTDKKVIGLAKNSFGLVENKSTATEETFSPTLTDGDFNINSTSVDKAKGKITIADADIVVSGGRGLKGPENWGMIEELADVLGAATACSKPVSDLGWRPHSEHVGQTGKPVASNLYIAIGISGAIQHLAGINSSKVKVVINNDPEAPFFKAADYGIVGDAFEVVPKLIEKLKEFKAQNT
ncbi:electron transfer flavoprotein subunit alpha/FixB family protein [Aureibaculum marinum]|uniref:Electron transfer flavoprotein subunit alpha/FixB family protein n=1 Tax=Aureibaculum marinum TaxID=2487930 RepID=A0A3N4P5S8_9FLAO|nr:electron transfer flavoprotein subunit alpha/FixB family protein [Aureibaculum marinum]RPD99059.1 electron transfer flavoprotein subunit alpha/FixB family protein [Aureibaculum marinum]